MTINLTLTWTRVSKAVVRRETAAVQLKGCRAVHIGLSSLLNRSLATLGFMVQLVEEDFQGLPDPCQLRTLEL